MNENLNLVEILKDCPKGTKLYSILHGEVEYEGVSEMDLYEVKFKDGKGDICGVKPDGRYFSSLNGECILFPSKDQRDWSKFKIKKPKFDPNTLQPFDKVLVKHSELSKWVCQFFSHNDSANFHYKYRCICSSYGFCRPYNDETKHLVGTNKEAPEYYRYWED